MVDREWESLKLFAIFCFLSFVAGFVLLLSLAGVL